MGLFREAGKKFEETKRSFTGGDGDEYVCRACEKRLTERYEHCPHCGEAAVEPAA
ncbi:hypothetical protein SAMN04488063_2262 [Halopelagius inordinatus]|uniref:Zinc-ribbon domain-containing protein n=1 Tax=Halopelagius inordinatus TaxID=553467 RepID=A0A1I2SDJ7_9EURY|nr:hypothetical protein [Halopelagius inordinatus]SFG50875.1 hypothetical protein SAMN04488063_2262 [Halopelagius inordinatus]